MILLENPSRYEDANGNKIECEGPLGSQVTVVFKGGRNTLVVDKAARLGKLKVMFDCNEGILRIGANRFSGTIRVGEGVRVCIGDGVTCTSPCYISAAEHASVTVGTDCMLASRNEIRADDAHPIFDVRTGKRVNMPKDIVIGDHVWIAAGAVLLGGTRIGNGSVVGLGAVVKSDFPNNCIIAGVPAKVVRRDIAWERPHLTLESPYVKPDAASISKSIYWDLTNDDLPAVESSPPADRLKFEKRSKDCAVSITERSVATPVLDLRVALSELGANEISRLFASNPKLRILRVDHASVACDERNLLDLAMKDKSIREVVVELANHAFVAYMLKDGVTSFVHHSYIGKLWKRVKDGPFQVDCNGLVYSVEEPLAGLAATRLVVVFSSMAGKIRTSGLMRHFEQNFATIQKYLPAGTAVLRIADFGGVVGGYYMNTVGCPNTESHVQRLIVDVSGKLHVNLRNVVLYGPSKGGTAALYHGLLGNYPVVAVDPILSDEYYIKTFNDSHFTVGVFPEDKQVKFSRLAAQVEVAKLAPVAILCSQRSPQYPYIMETLCEPLRSHIAFFDSRHVGIKTHPDVSPKTLNLAVMLLNMHCYKLSVSGGVHVVDDVECRDDADIRAP